MAQSPSPVPPRAAPAGKFSCAFSSIILGVAWLAGLYYFILAQDWRLHHDYVECRCVVLEKRLDERGDEDSSSYRPEIHVRYTADGRQRDVWTYDSDGAYNADQNAQQRALDGFAVGQEYPLWYDPADPDKAVLVRNDHSGSYWISAIPIGLIVLGFLAFFAPNPPPAAACSPRDLARALAAVPGLADVAARLGRAGALGTPAAPQAAGQGAPGPIARAPLPTVPDPFFYEQPGTVLAVGLRPGTPQAVAWMKTGILLTFGALSAVAALSTLVKSPACGAPLLLLVACPLLYWGGRNWLVQTRVGPTTLELSSHPLRPGQPFEMLLNQAGPLRLRRLWVQLICEESVNYRQGTDTRYETKCVGRQMMLDGTDVEITRDAPLAWRDTVVLSDGAMHSFKAPNNEVRWKLLVHGEPAGLPRFERDFPVVVAPTLDSLPPTGEPAR